MKLTKVHTKKNNNIYQMKLLVSSNQTLAFTTHFLNIFTCHEVKYICTQPQKHKTQLHWLTMDLRHSKQV